jgi:hypothetical protein
MSRLETNIAICGLLEQLEFSVVRSASNFHALEEVTMIGKVVSSLSASLDELPSGILERLETARMHAIRARRNA